MCVGCGSQEEERTAGKSRETISVGEPSSTTDHLTAGIVSMEVCAYLQVEAQSVGGVTYTEVIWTAHDAPRILLAMDLNNALSAAIA